MEQRLIHARVGETSMWIRPDAVVALYVAESYDDDGPGWSINAVVRGRDVDVWLGQVPTKEEAELRMVDIAKELAP